MTRILTYGTFDLFHDGHRNLLKRAKEMGDALYVGVSTNSFCRIKGKPKPIMEWWERAQHVKDYADVVFMERRWDQKVRDITDFHIDILVMGSDWANDERFMKLPCDVRFLPRTPGISSTLLRRQHDAGI